MTRREVLKYKLLDEGVVSFSSWARTSVQLVLVCGLA